MRLAHSCRCWRRHCPGSTRRSPVRLRRVLLANPRIVRRPGAPLGWLPSLLATVCGNVLGPVPSDGTFTVTEDENRVEASGVSGAGTLDHVSDPVDGVVAEFLRQMREAASPERAVAMAAYMKNVAPFLGVGAGERRRIQRAVFPRGGAGLARRSGPAAQAAREQRRAHALQLGDALWALRWRECRYAAIDILSSVATTLDPATLDDVVMRWVSDMSWWDTVDELAAHVVGPILARHREARDPRVAQWSVSADMWRQRTAVLFQLRYGPDTDWQLLAEVIDTTSAGLYGAEFFIRKAIGWALRTYSAVDPAAVIAFVDDRPHLSGLSRREALRRIDPELVALTRARRAPVAGGRDPR